VQSPNTRRQTHILVIEIATSLCFSFGTSRCSGVFDTIRWLSLEVFCLQLACLLPTGKATHLSMASRPHLAYSYDQIISLTSSVPSFPTNSHIPMKFELVTITAALSTLPNPRDGGIHLHPPGASRSSATESSSSLTACVNQILIQIYVQYLL
jgi:hypothetical protein